MNKSFVALSTLAALTVASPVMARSSHSAHVSLARAVESVGMTVYVNPSICDEVNALGMYVPDHKAVVICQENRIKGSTAVVQWTEEDYDTLRHEVHHVVQDCRDSYLNGQLNAVYKNPINLGIGVLGRDGANRVAEMYARQGASEHIQVMEIEAFAVAAMNDPAEQIRDIQNFCF